MTQFTRYVRPMRTRSRKLIAVSSLAALAVAVAGCGDSGSNNTAGTAATKGGGTSKAPFTTLEVGEGKAYSTIQKAVDAAKGGELILLSPGVYKEAVVVEKDNLVIRGLDRNKVIIDGEFTRDNGIKVLANGVAVENLTARNHKSNGVFFTGDYDSKVVLNGYRVSYVTVYNNGDYGIYAFNATRGQFDHDYGSGHPDSPYYIGQCNPCNAVVSEVVAENNFLGYSGTNSTGVSIVNSRFSQNRIGISPQSQDGEKEAPNDGGIIAGNNVYDNNNAETPQKDEKLDLAFGTGIVAAGTNNYKIVKNRVVDNKRANIVLILWPFGQIFDPHKNEVRDNVTAGAKEYADLVLALGDTSGGSLDNCFTGNTFESTRPAAIEKVAPCGSASEKDFEIIDVTALSGKAPPYKDYKTMTPPPDQPGMADPATAPPVPANKSWNPITVDLDKIKVPAKA